MGTLDLSHVFAGLKDFQLATVDHATDRLYGPDPTSRFLVADEVGLGKTLVARGVIARSIEHHLEQGTDRIDIVYICSNVDIARQNVGRLNVLERNDFNLATRITLLPRILQNLQGNRINFVSFTPGTSFDLRSSEGIVEERILLYWMLRSIWGAGVVKAYPRDKRVFCGWAGFDRFAARLDRFGVGGFDATLGQRFADELLRHDQARPADSRSLQDRYLDLRDRLARVGRSGVPNEVASLRSGFIGDLREVLARTCVEALEPDLVILDEFQRFKHLLDGSDPSADLARRLFDYEDVRVLLLSATPYKMYTVADEAEDDHYADFLDTLEFLLGAGAIEEFASHLRRYRQGLFDLDHEGATTTCDAKEAIEKTLRTVMARTERLAVSTDRSGMLSEKQVKSSVGPDDLRQYLALSGLCDELDVGGALEYWKSTPYPVAFMDGYEVDRRLERRLADGNGQAEGLRRYLHGAGLTLTPEDVERYERIDPANFKLRSLISDVVDRGGWKLLWVPPSMPYYRLGGVFDDPELDGFTKRLVFSAWTVVPRVIGTLVSYEAERRMMRAGGESENSAAARARFSGLLRFQRAKGRLAGMPALALLYPSPSLAELGDPRRLAGELGGHDRPPSADVVLRTVRERIRDQLADKIAAAPTSGPEDDRWYWAGPLLLDLDRDAEASLAWLDRPDAASRWAGTENGDEIARESGWRDHVAEAASFVAEPDAFELGRPPADLLDVLAEFAIAGPGICALRALDRVNPVGLTDLAMRDHAGAVAWGLRHLFNLIETTHLLRSESGGGGHREDAYWRLVLRYCFDGCIQSVLDEYIHVVKEWRGVTGVTGDALLDPISETIREALTIRTVNYSVRHVTDDEGELGAEKQRMRGMFALRFGDEGSDDGKSVQRASSVRTAFNSPFRPFVLATTSVGQEGLDFHTYCHAIMHWNLPRNPVDLEQREGRVHRYKGHAVRKNAAADHRAVALGDQPDPWQAVFDAAADGRADHDNELVPYWIYPREGGATIERYVPAIPLSQAKRKRDELLRSLAAYRLVFGQPRQDDLLAYLQDRVASERIAELLDDLRIDLTPSPLSVGRRAELVEPRPIEFDAPEAGASTPSGRSGTERSELYRDFWQQTLDELHAAHPDWVGKRKAPTTSWVPLRCGISGAHYTLVFASGSRIRVELYNDATDPDVRERVWEELSRTRSKIETAFGEPLTYEPLPGRRASRIAVYHQRPAAIMDEKAWDGYRAWFLTRAGRLRAALQPRLDSL